MPAEVVTSENLAEFNAARMPQPLEVVEEVAEDPPEPVKAKEVDGEPVEQDEPKEDKPRRKPGIEGRFSELSQRAKEATARAEAAEARARELEEKLNPPEAKPKDAKPDPKEFADAFDYAEKLAEWSTNEALKARDRADADKAAKSESEKATKAFQARMAAAKEVLPDLEDILADSDLAVSDQVRDAIIESDQGPQILHYLAKNPDKADAINGMTVAKALREIGRLEAKLETTAVKEEPKPRKEPPAPIAAIRRSFTADDPINSDGEFKGTYAEYKAARSRNK